MESSRSLGTGLERVRNPKFKLHWQPFLHALADVVVSDIEFLATGECVESLPAKSSQIEEPKK
jgi:hypothetical protein